MHTKIILIFFLRFRNFCFLLVNGGQWRMPVLQPTRKEQRQLGHARGTSESLILLIDLSLEDRAVNLTYAEEIYTVIQTDFDFLRKFRFFEKISVF